MTEQEIIDNAIAEAKIMRTRVAREFTDKAKYRPSLHPASIFMSGSPGAGKTEISKELVAFSEEGGHPLMRIDPDEFRDLFQMYDGCNSHLFQRAIVPIVERVLDMALANSQDFILDGTLSNFEVAKKNIVRNIRRNRQVHVIYVFQEPLISWDFVKAREETEGRRILPEIFVDQFFRSWDSVNNLKSEFGDALSVDVIVKDYNQSIGEWLTNVDRVDDRIIAAYNPRALLEAIKTG